MAVMEVDLVGREVAIVGGVGNLAESEIVYTAEHAQIEEDGMVPAAVADEASAVVEVEMAGGAALALGSVVVTVRESVAATSIAVVLEAAALFDDVELVGGAVGMAAAVEAADLRLLANAAAYE